MRPSALACLAVAVASASVARAAVVDSAAGGFEVADKTEIAAPPAQVFAALRNIGAWWDPQHTFSSDAKNLTLEAKAGGCFCEALPNGGSMRHMAVVYVAPGQALRLEGALGPLQGLAVTGHLTWALKPAPQGHTLLTQTYDVGGWARGGLETWSKPVDGVLSDQLARLKRYVETGKPG